MINNNIIALSAALALMIMLLSGCSISTHSGILSPGLVNTITSPETPTYQGKPESTNYISGKVLFSEPHTRRKDRNFVGSVRFYRAKTKEYQSVTYGAFGYLGNYKSGNFIPASLSGNHIYGGLGLMGGINWHVPFEKMDWEVFKLNARLYNELGKYPRLKNELTDYRNNHDEMLPPICSGFIFPSCRPAPYSDLYSRHIAMLDTSIGMGIKIKHKGRHNTQIGAGINFHLLGSSRNSFSVENPVKPINTAGFYLQFSHTLRERLSLNIDLIGGGITTGLSYQFGKK